MKDIIGMKIGNTLEQLPKNLLSVAFLGLVVLVRDILFQILLVVLEHKH